MHCPLPPPHIAPLLRALRAPVHALAFSESEWDRVLRMARNARLHGLLAHRIARLAPRQLPKPVAEQLLAARNEARFARQMVQHELTEVQRALASLDVDLLLLKGGAYIVQDLECAHGRLPADLDVLVERAAFDRVEQALVDAGWRRTELGAYDTRYYRRWTHQAPPLRAPGHVVELDLHHAILPPSGRRRVDSAKLWKASVRIGDRLRVLEPVDQVIHAVVHLFVDSDCTNRLRDVVDIAQLMEQFGRGNSDFPMLLRARAHDLGVAGAVAHAAAFASEWLGAPAGAALRRPMWLPRAARALIARRLAPPDPDALPPCVDGVHALLAARALALRLPWHRALAHVASQPLRRVLAR